MRAQTADGWQGRFRLAAALAVAVARGPAARAVAALAVAALACGCGFPRTRDCFPVTSPEAPALPEPPPVTRPPPALAASAALAVVARGLDRPIAAAQLPGDDGLLVAEQGGRIVIVRDGEVLPRPFADLSDRVARDTRDQGLLGLAVHPALDDERIYVNYTGRGDGATYVVELRADPEDPDRADLARARQVLRIGQPWPNNNGGHVAFGPDWKLYVGVGDGGGAGDPRGNAQRCGSWRGKMLRVDVGAAGEERSRRRSKPAASNNNLGGEPPVVEVIGVGLQNPWRYSFDRQTQEMYVTDVSAGRWESIFILRRSNVVGHNFGWPITEGGRCVREAGCDRAGLTAPAYAYPRAQGCAVTGGYVYRGRALPGLDGLYFFSDLCAGTLRSLRWKHGRVAEVWDWKPALDPGDRVRRVVSFAEDRAGELYLLSLDGAVYKLVPRAPAAEPEPAPGPSAP